MGLYRATWGRWNQPFKWFSRVNRRYHFVCQCCVHQLNSQFPRCYCENTFCLRASWFEQDEKRQRMSLIGEYHRCFSLTCCRRVRETGHCYHSQALFPVLYALTRPSRPSTRKFSISRYRVVIYCTFLSLQKRDLTTGTSESRVS